ncbi:Kelch motif-containing protein 2 [Elsinoe fawcettii]|nr:Kelch motif-containing protein 2 [Elsinoe fawcettii]
MDSIPEVQNVSPIPRRKSAFVETGLIDADVEPISLTEEVRPKRSLRFNSTPDIFEFVSEEPEPESDNADLDHQLAIEKQRLEMRRSQLEGSTALYRLSVGALVLAVLVPLLQGTPWAAHSSSPLLGVKGGPIKRDAGVVLDADPSIVKRQSNSPTDVCSRWAHMSAMVNGTLYIYGGEATTEPGQTSNTWNNNFLSLDLTRSFQISDPPFKGLAQPSGPPAVSLGSLWHSYDSLFLYGGEYSSDPPASPDAFSLWEYDIPSSRWVEHSEPRTSSGQFSSPENEPVQRAAEGSGVSIPSLGRAYYFGGHQDGYTTQGWSQSIWRIYLTSLLEFTFPGSSNPQVESLSNYQAAPAEGTWRNITTGGVQDTAGFPERADGLLLYVPGYGAEGILIGLAGGTNTTFQQMSQLDVYDIATSTWYKQATTGSTPKIRVNPCAVVASAADGSSQNIYMFGGQNLQPAGDQTQYDDMWILTLPSFTWIQVDQTNQPIPYARAGHTCNIWNAQMVLVGGYVGPEVSCDSPGVYVFDLSTLKWNTAYESRSGDDASITSNPLNQQVVQRQSGPGPDGLEGSYGYSVPKVIRDVIGGNEQGGATVTAPAQLPTDGPMKTGRAVTYTVTATATGGRVTETASSGAVSPSGPNIGAIVAAVVAGVLGVIALYLAFCLWLYKKRLRQYKRHLEMANRLSFDETPFAAAGFYGDGGPDKDGNESSPFVSGGETRHGSGQAGSAHGSGGSGKGYGDQRKQYNRAEKSVDDLLSGGEPSFWGTALSPKRSLRVTNSD